jgi:mannonate dehydratase
MDRRDFLAGIGAGAAAGSAVGAGLPAYAATAVKHSSPGARPKLLMKLGCQSSPSTDEHFAFLARYGVTHIAAEGNARKAASIPPPTR